MVNRNYGKDGDAKAAAVLAHELIHALGIGHATAGMESIMTVTLPTTADNLPLPILYCDDRRALNFLYSEAETGTSVTSYGEWNSTITHLAANNDDVAFGVAHVDGYSEPWAYGIRPDMSLSDNPDLIGTARWSGLLLGFTSDELPLSGRSSLSIQLDDLTGTARFTNLETWDAGSIPGVAGAGTAWSRRYLYYDVLVTDNTFRQIGGDEGTVTGAFFGESHEGAGGVVERSDMSAAFGASR